MHSRNGAAGRYLTSTAHHPSPRGGAGRGQQRAARSPETLATLAPTIWAITAPRRKAEARPSLPRFLPTPPQRRTQTRPKTHPKNAPKNLFTSNFSTQPPPPTTPKKQTPKKPYRIADASGFSIWRRGGGTARPPERMFGHTFTFVHVFGIERLFYSILLTSRSC